MAFSDNPLFDQLVDAAVLDQPAATQLLQAHPELLMMTNRLGETVLHFLAVEDYADAVAFLARQGAPVNTHNDAQRTPLMEAAMVGASQVVRVLLTYGADPSIQTVDGDTVWDLLAPERSAELLEILYGHGFIPPQQSA
ncbi:MAG: hypothetical protein OHK0012_03870 [Synechococcales cyanobacterium]